MKIDGSAFASQFAKSGQAATKAAFEYRFESIQGGIIKRLNKEITKITNDDSLEREIRELQNKRNDLASKAPSIERYQYGLTVNESRLYEIRDEAAAASLLDADSNDTLDSDEVASINSAKDAIAEKIRYLLDLYHPGLHDGDLVLRMRQYADTLDTLTAETGVIDASGTSPESNNNRSLIDQLAEISTSASTAAFTTNLLVGSTNQMLIDIQKKAYEYEADLMKATSVELAKKSNEIDELKIRYGNLLRAVSISFEVSSGLGDVLADSIQRQNPKGSILNLFS